MLYLLKRTFWFNKRRQLKTDLDKTQNTLKQAIEMSLKTSTRKGEGDQVDLGQLKANFKFVMSKDGVTVLNSFVHELKDYTLANNEYLKNKAMEEKARVSKDTRFMPHLF